MSKLLQRKFRVIQHEGYSMTEILVVVAILTFIAGFALPLYGETIRKNREKAVINDLQAIRSASLVYREINNGFWDTADAWENTLATINATLGTSIVDLSGLPITYSYIYEETPGNLTHAVRADWIENSNRSVIEIRETNLRVVTGPCCNTGLPGPATSCAIRPANLPVCP